MSDPGWEVYAVPIGMEHLIDEFDDVGDGVIAATTETGELMLFNRIGWADVNPNEGESA